MAAIGPATEANGRRYRRDSSNFTRPNDTNAYASGDLLANSTTAASVSPLTWQTGGSKPFEVPGIRFHKTGATGNISYRVHLFAASPTVATTGDNGAFASNVSGAANCIAIYEGTAYGYADGATGLLVPISGVIKQEYVGDPATVYGLVEVRSAWTPVAQEVITATLIMEYDQ